MGNNRGAARRRLRRSLADAFAARQIIVRAGGRMRYVEVTPRAQAGAALLAALVIGWSVVAGIGAWHASGLAISHAVAVASARDSDRALLEARRTLRDLLDENEELRTGLASTGERLRTTEVERERVVRARMTARSQLTRLAADLQRVAAENDSLARRVDEQGASMRALGDRNAELVVLRTAQDERIETLTARLAEALVRAARLDAGLDAATLQLASSERALEAAVAANAPLGGRIAELEERIAAADDLHRRTVQRFDERALAGILEVEALVGRAGIRIETLVPGKPVEAPRPAARRRANQGGPFVPWRPREAPPSAEELRISLAERVDRLQQLRDLARALPLRAPLDEATLMSGFGYRRDPLNNAPAMHLGVDLSAPLRSQVHPAASGTVVFAGWQEVYGRLIEIDHGFGIRTRYAHLARTLVEAGETVSVERPIGLLGNSGRTTGPHLHYEVLVHGKNVDPEKFMRARTHVQ